MFRLLGIMNVPETESECLQVLEILRLCIVIDAL